MTSRRDPTPAEDYEWLLSGLRPEAAVAVLEHDIKRLEHQVSKLQTKLAHAHVALKRARADEYPKDDDGLITLAPNNPLA